MYCIGEHSNTMIHTTYIVSVLTIAIIEIYCQNLLLYSRELQKPQVKSIVLHRIPLVTTAVTMPGFNYVLIPCRAERVTYNAISKVNHIIKNFYKFFMSLSKNL